MDNEQLHFWSNPKPKIEGLNDTASSLKQLYGMKYDILLRPTHFKL